VTDEPLEIVAERVDFAFGAHQVLHDISVTVRAGARVGIVGESGSGKTTLARLLVGALADGVRGVTVNGRPWAAVARRDPLRRHVQMIFQDPYASLTPSRTAIDTVREAVRVCQRLPRREAATAAERLLESVGVGTAAARRPHELSGGQCQRVAIARTLAANPRLIVADEPTSALDVSVQAQIINVLLDLMSSHQVGLVLVSHDLAVVRHLTHELLVMHRGTIVERGPTLKVIDNPQHPYTQRLCQAQRDHAHQPKQERQRSTTRIA
jgi:ABC-type glutathione transport system ATPase component